MYVCILSV